MHRWNVLQTTYLGVAISLDNGTLEKLVLLCSFLGYRYKYTLGMWVKSPFSPPKKVCESLSRHNLTSWTLGDLCQPGGSLMWHLERNTVNTEEASDRDKQASALFHREPDADTERCSDNCVATKKKKRMTAPKRRRLLLTKWRRTCIVDMV